MVSGVPAESPSMILSVMDGVNLQGLPRFFGAGFFRFFDGFLAAMSHFSDWRFQEVKGAEWSRA